MIRIAMARSRRVEQSEGAEMQRSKTVTNDKNETTSKETKSQQIRIGPVDYTIRYQERLLDSDGITKLSGSHSAQALELIVDANNAPQFQYTTLFHERVHAIEAQYNGHTLGEAVVDHMAQGLAQVFRDNFDFLEAELKKISDDKRGE